MNKPRQFASWSMIWCEIQDFLQFALLAGAPCRTAPLAAQQADSAPFRRDPPAVPPCTARGKPGAAPGRQPARLANASAKVNGASEFERHPQVEPLNSRTVLTPTGRTPLDSDNPTPLAAEDAQDQRPLLAVLAIIDSSGTPKIDILGLPFQIGRSGNQDYKVPDGNGGVSREHLVITEINAEGALVRNKAHAKNGCQLGGSAMLEHFIWPFDQELVLAARWTAHPPVRVTLLRPTGGR